MRNEKILFQNQQRRKKELNLPEIAVNDEIEEGSFEIYNNRVKNQEEITRYKEVPEEEESHLNEKPVTNKEIVVTIAQIPLVKTKTISTTF